MALKRTAAATSKRPNGNATKRLSRERERPSSEATAPRTITVRVPLAMRQRGGRKVILTPHGTPQWAPPKVRIDNTLVKALARAHRWKHLIESGKYGSVGELAASENINESYVCRVLRLTLLAPDIVEAILDGRQNKAWQLEQMLVPFPMEWSAQRGGWNGGFG
jgi:hypothetical protein